MVRGAGRTGQSGPGILAAAPAPLTARPTAPPPGALQALLSRRIQDQGPITFADYMELALYEPTHGYYACRVPGLGGDYRTAPSLGPWFGRLFARAAEQMWEVLQRPDELTVVEVGAGRGDLPLAALEALPESLAGHVRWIIVERFEAVQAMQLERLAAVGEAITWRRELGGGVPVTGCVLANEVLDNQPVHLLEHAGSEAVEIHVGLQDGRLVEVAGPLSHPSLAGPAAAAMPYLEEGDRFEVGLGTDAWIAEAASALNSGWVVAIDYGDEEPDLWLRRPAGSLVTYRDEGLGLDPLASPGEADITAHVNFSALARGASAVGLEPQATVTQRDWLRSLGSGDMADSLRARQDEAQRAGDHTEMVRLLADRSRLTALSARGGLGDFRVFAAAKNAPALGQARPS